MVGCYEDSTGPEVPVIGGITLSQEQMTVGAEGGEYSVNIYTEYAFQASSSVNWIEISYGSCGTEYCTQYFDVKANDTTSSREGVITIFCDDYNLSATLTVVQEAGTEQGSGTSIPNNQIWYTATEKVTPYKPDVFGANIVSNTYENGKGVITFDDDVTSIGDWAFYRCRSLTSITIPDSVTSIGDFAFEECISLTSVTIPDSVTLIGSYAFEECHSLISVTIGDSVTSIGKDAFFYCKSLTNITIPDSVTSIGEYAFYDCYSLKEVYCKPTIPPMGGYDMFYFNASGRKIYVPVASVEAYKSAEYWSEYADAIVAYDFEKGEVVPDYNTETGHNPEPYVSEMVELMGLIFRLAGAKEYSNCYVASVADSADDYFASMKSSTAVTLAKQYRTKGVSYDAVTGYANLLIFDDNGNIVFDPDYKEGSNTSFDRWTNTQKEDMLAAVNSLYKESKFHTWFESIKPEQEAAVAAFKKECNMDYAWLDSFYGKIDNISSRIILSFMAGGGNYGNSFTRKNGTFLLTPVFGSLSQTNGSITFKGSVELLAHEFSHPYCNPIINANWTDISAKAAEVYNKVSDLMKSQAYNNSKTMMYETLVRSCAIRYMIDHGYNNSRNTLISNQENRGFLMVGTIVDTLDKYDHQESDKYATLSDFMPEIIKAINNFDPNNY